MEEDIQNYSPTGMGHTVLFFILNSGDIIFLSYAINPQVKELSFLPQNEIFPKFV